VDIGLFEIVKFIYVSAFATACIVLAGRYYSGLPSGDSASKKKAKWVVFAYSYPMLMFGFLTADPLVTAILGQ